ncbi:Vacuolar protein sorting-associated protein 51 [Nymphon striatum]|nr:Vacuolar protein sorting-associated protein 51 [Nymphon striatum]
MAPRLSVFFANFDEDAVRKRKRGLLRQYYGKNDANGEISTEAYNINSSEFVSDVYLNKLLKECSLTDLMDRRNDICKQIQSLDSEMQTLVYENYNKFISATDTIRKMKNDFKKMEDEMDGLATNMESITKFSGTVSDTLQDRRQQIDKLSNVHSLLKKLQFLFELPTKLKECLEQESYAKAVGYYTKAQKVLKQYQHMPSFHGIQNDCDTIIDELKNKLRQQFKAKEAAPKQIAVSIELLLELKEPAETLCDEFLEHARDMLNTDLDELDYQVKQKRGDVKLVTSQMPRPADAYSHLPMDILEFVDLGCNGFLGNLSLIVASYTNMFVNRPLTHQYDDLQEMLEKLAQEKLLIFVSSLLNQYFDIVRSRMNLEGSNFASSANCSVARFFLYKCDYLLLSKVYFPTEAFLIHCAKRISWTEKRTNDSVLKEANVTRSLIKNKDTGDNTILVRALDRFYRRLQPINKLLDCLTDIRQTLAAPKIVNQESNNTLTELLHKTMVSVADQIKSVLSNLQRLFNKPNIINTSPGIIFAECDLALVDEQFGVDDAGEFELTAVSELKSVDTRDWLNTIEPRNVRAVMKRVVEDITAIETEVGQLYDEGSRKERSSDSSRRTFPNISGGRFQNTSGASAITSVTGVGGANKTWSSYGPSVIDNSLMSNIQRLFSERIEIFSRVELSKVSVLTGIIKIGLKKKRVVQHFMPDNFPASISVNTAPRSFHKRSNIILQNRNIKLTKSINTQNIVNEAPPQNWRKAVVSPASAGISHWEGNPVTPSARLTMSVDGTGNVSHYTCMMQVQSMGIHH